MANQRLTVKFLDRLSEPGRYGDGGGLYAQLTTSGGRSWVFRYKLRGRDRENWMGLGALADFSLADARERARVARQLVKDGIDPIAARKEEADARALAEAKRITFEVAARDYFLGHEQKWSNADHRRQFLASLVRFAFPVIGRLPVAMIDTGLVLKCVEPIWIEKSVTASRVRNRIEAVLDWATARGYRTGPNPAAWKGHLETILPKPGKIKKVAHHAAMPYVAVPAFVEVLAAREDVPSRALEFLILTAARTGEVASAKWSEFDLDKRIWTVPPERMKGRKEHRVPLSDPAIAILRKLPREGDFVFIGSIKNRSMNKLSMLKVIWALGSDVTVHGFRSSFRDWAAERTSFPRDICEEALAHSVGTATERSYRRSDVLEKRRQLMDQWAAFCTMPKRDATVTPIRKGRA
jgi:integrase